MISSNQKRFQLCFVRNSPRGTSEPRVFHQTENRARVRANPHLVVYEGLLLRGLRSQSYCGIFATLGEYFCPITLPGDFPVRMSQLEHVGGRAHGCRDDSIDCDSGVRCRFRAGPLGHEATPFRRRKVEDETVIATSPTRPSSALARGRSLRPKDQMA